VFGLVSIDLCAERIYPELETTLEVIVIHQLSEGNLKILRHRNNDIVNQDISPSAFIAPDVR